MSKMKTDLRSRSGWLVVVGAALLLFFLWRGLSARSLLSADQLELRATYDRWVEAGRPEHDNLAKFLDGRRTDLTYTNRSFTIGATNFVTQFALTRLKSRSEATLFVTTNRVLIYQEGTKIPKVVAPN